MKKIYGDFMTFFELPYRELVFMLIVITYS